MYKEEGVSKTYICKHTKSQYYKMKFAQKNNIIRKKNFFLKEKPFKEKYIKEKIFYQFYTYKNGHGEREKLGRNIIIVRT